MRLLTIIAVCLTTIAASSAEPMAIQIAQVYYSPKCATPAGTCLVEPPRPIGSPCACGPNAGRIIP